MQNEQCMYYIKQWRISHIVYVINCVEQLNRQLRVDNIYNIYVDSMYPSDLLA